MSIIRVHKHERYVLIEKTGLEDPRLSFRAKGVLSYLLSKPDNWTINYRHLEQVGPDGKAAMLRALRELEKAGYLVRERKHIDGRYAWEQVLYEYPHNAPQTGALSGPKTNALKTGAFSDKGSSEVDNAPKTNPSYLICDDCGCAVLDRDLEAHQKSHGATA